MCARVYVCVRVCSGFLEYTQRKIYMDKKYVCVCSGFLEYI